MKVLISFTLICTLFAGCSKDRLTASGDKTTETRFPGEFTGLSTSGSNPVHIAYGTTFKIELKGSGNLLPYFKTRVMTSTLYLGYEKASVQHDDVEVFITLPIIKKLAISGKSTVSIAGSFAATDYFRLSISGTGQVFVKDAFQSDEVLIDISGNGKADLQNISSKDAKVHLSGKGDVSIKVQNKLKARISGSGNVYYTGDPEVDAALTGSGKVIKI